MRQRLAGIRLEVWLTLLLALRAVFAAPDYGVHWDEGYCRLIAQSSVQYIRTGSPAVLAWSADHDHGPAFEIPVYLAERVAALLIEQPVRALLIHLAFLGAALVWASALRRSGMNRFAAVLLWAMLVLHPRIYAHSFYNSKDIGALIAFLLVQAAAVRWLQRRTAAAAAWVGAAIGYAIAVRITGLIALPALAAALLLGRGASRKDWIQLGGIWLMALLCAWAFWPAAWAHPWRHLIWSFTRSSRFLAFNGLVLFRGTLLPAPLLPGYYPVWWMGISTPLAWWPLLVAGLFAAARTRSAAVLFPAIVAVGSLLAVWCFHSILYDDWRHLYYLWPCLLWPAGRLLQSRRTGGKIAKTLAVAGLAASCLAAVTLHPFGGVYFNELLSFRKREYLRSQYDLDYWAVGYRKGLRWLAAHQPSGTILLYRPSLSVAQNVAGLPPALRERFRLTADSTEARYRITNFRGHPAEFGGRCLYRVYRQNSSVLAVYQMPWRPPDAAQP